jgi:hypothetical protein
MSPLQLTILFRRSNIQLLSKVFREWLLSFEIAHTRITARWQEGRAPECIPEKAAPIAEAGTQTTPNFKRVHRDRAIEVLLKNSQS